MDEIARDFSGAIAVLVAASEPVLVRESLLHVAETCLAFLHKNAGDFECMHTLERLLPIPQVDPIRVREWFGGIKDFPLVDLLVQIVSFGAPVPVAEGGDLESALEYGNHRSALQHDAHILAKIREDVQYGRAFVFPYAAAYQIAGLRVSPLGVVVNPKKARIINDLRFSGVNRDTDTSNAPECKLGHVLRDVVWRVLYLYNEFVRNAPEPPPAILISKIDSKDAFRQVPVERGSSPAFGYAFGDVIVVDRRLQFGWNLSAQYFCLCTDAIEHSHNHTTVDTAVVTSHGQAATAHVRVLPAVEVEQTHLPVSCVLPPGSGGGIADPFFARAYVDDIIGVEVHHERPRNDRCLIASASLASDHFRLFGDRPPGFPPLFSSSKLTSWESSLEVLGWVIDTKAMSISVPQAKLVMTHDLLAEWAVRSAARENEVRSLMGKLLNLCEIVRPGKFFVMRMLNQLKLPPARPGDEHLSASDGGSHGYNRFLTLGPEFRSDVSFWLMMIEGALGDDKRGRLEMPLYSFYLQPHCRTLWSDASGDAMGGYCLETGKYWRMDFPTDVRQRLRQHVLGRDDLSINLLELLGMVVTAWAFTVDAGTTPEYQGQSVLMRGDNMSAVHWCNQCRGAREPRSGALMRMMGCLEMRSGWCFRARHVKGISNTLADGISRWDHDRIAPNLHAFRPDIQWQVQELGQAGRNLVSDTLASSSSDNQLRLRLDALTRRVSNLGARFEG